MVRPLNALRQIRRDPAVFALVGTVLAFVVLGMIQSLGVPAFRPLDEPRHVAYAIELGRGRLPTVFDHVPVDHCGAELVRGSQEITAANHPPLYYALVALPIKLGLEHGHFAAGILVARGLTLLMAAAGLVFVFRALSWIVPERRSIAVAAVAFTAATPGFLNCSALVMNDALAFLAAAALYDVSLAIVTQGPTRGRSITFIVWLTISALTRFAALLVFPPALAAVVLGYLFHAEGRVVSRLLRGSLIALAAVASAALFSGYFYYRNHVLYGDVTGTKALVEQLHRTPREPFIHHVTNGWLWLDMSDQLWERLGGGVRLDMVSTVGRVSLALGGLSIFKWIFDERRTLIAAPWKNPRFVGGLLIVAGYFMMTLPIFEFYARGGQLSPRYFFPMLWAPCLFVAFGFSSFRTPIAIGGAVSFMLFFGFIVTELYLARLLTTSGGDLAVFVGLSRAGLPLADWITALLLALYAGGSFVAAFGVGQSHAVNREATPSTGG